MIGFEPVAPACVLSPMMTRLMCLACSQLLFVPQIEEVLMVCYSLVELEDGRPPVHAKVTSSVCTTRMKNIPSPSTAATCPSTFEEATRQRAATGGDEVEEPSLGR